jgi:hypothetical protein
LWRMSKTWTKTRSPFTFQVCRKCCKPGLNIFWTSWWMLRWSQDLFCQDVCVVVTDSIPYYWGRYCQFLISWASSHKALTLNLLSILASKRDLLTLLQELSKSWVVHLFCVLCVSFHSVWWWA